MKGKGHKKANYEELKLTLKVNLRTCSASSSIAYSLRILGTFSSCLKIVPTTKIFSFLAACDSSRSSDTL